MGKTAFALNIAQNVALRKKVPVAIFSLEMSKEQLVQRMLCSEAEVDSQKIRTGHMQSKDWEKLANAMNDFADAPIYIDDSGGCSLTDIRAKCRRLAMEEKDLGLIVIDYLQLMEGNGKDDRIQQISAISRGLKTLARELDVPVIALSQLSRAVEQRKDRRPMLSDLRESGAIEQDADIVMFIYRDDYYNREEGEDDVPKATGKEGKSEIIIAKQRNGPVGSFELLFQGNITKFKNPIKTDTF
jgi:replicative DNA helicase